MINASPFISIFNIILGLKGLMCNCIFKFGAIIDISRREEKHISRCVLKNLGGGWCVPKHTSRCVFAKARGLDKGLKMCFLCHVLLPSEVFCLGQPLNWQNTPLLITPLEKEREEWKCRTRRKQRKVGQSVAECSTYGLIHWPAPGHLKISSSD